MRHKLIRILLKPPKCFKIYLKKNTKKQKNNVYWPHSPEHVLTAGESLTFFVKFVSFNVQNQPVKLKCFRYDRTMATKWWANHWRLYQEIVNEQTFMLVDSGSLHSMPFTNGHCLLSSGGRTQDCQWIKNACLFP